LTEVNAAVQVKRWKGNVQSQNVTQVRGSLEIHQQGIIITTSDYSSGARKEASAPGKTRIGLINGEELLDLLVKHKIGVTEKTLVVNALDDEWWGELIRPERAISPPIVAPRVMATTSGTLANLDAAAMTGSRPHQFTFLGQSHQVQSWIEILKQVCLMLAAKLGDEFVGELLQLQGRKRPYFAVSPEPLRKAVWLSQVDLWMETNLSAKAIIRILQQLLRIGQLPLDQLMIDLIPAG
jgi:restriction system protein